MWSISPMKQPLLEFPSSKPYAKIRNSQCVKLAIGVATVVAAAVVIWKDYHNIKRVIRIPEPFYIRAMLMLYSFWFSIVGISALANSVFKLPTPVRLGTAASLRGYEDDEEIKRNSKIIIRMFVAAIMMIALLFTTCYGIKLIIWPISEDGLGLYTLTIFTGVATVIFGVIYFTIGVLIMVELAGGLASANKRTEGYSTPRSGSSDAADTV